MKEVLLPIGTSLKEDQWTTLCENCDIFRDKPCMCCKRELERHDRRKKSKCTFECRNILFCKGVEEQYKKIEETRSDPKCRMNLA